MYAVLNRIKIRVRKGFGELRKLILSFSKTWKVLEKRSFYDGYGKVLGFCLGKFNNTLKLILLSIILNTIYGMVVSFTIHNLKHNPPKVTKYGIENSKCERKCVSWSWKFGKLALEKFWKSLENMFRVVCANPVNCKLLEF